MVLTTNLSDASHNRVRVTAAERGCTIRHLLETAVVKFAEAKSVTPLGFEKISVKTPGFKTHLNRNVKITTSFSEDGRAILTRLKQERGYPLSQSMELALRWYLWESPDASQPRHAFAEAFLPLIDAPVKEKWVSTENAPDLYQIADGAHVLVDSSVLLLAMDSRKIGYFDSRSLQADSLVSRIKDGHVRGFITSHVIAEAWDCLGRAYSGKENSTSGSLSQGRSAAAEICRRLRALCSGPLVLLSTAAEDVEVAANFEKEISVKPGLALSLAAALRTVGSGFAFATANPDHVGLAEPNSFRLHSPSDIDQEISVPGSHAPQAFLHAKDGKFYTPPAGEKLKFQKSAEVDVWLKEWEEKSFDPQI